MRADRRTSQVVKILRATKALLKTPGKLVKDGAHVAEDRQGGELYRPQDPRACRFCVMGALERVHDGAVVYGGVDDTYWAARNVLSNAANKAGFDFHRDPIPRNHKLVMKLFTRAIKIAQGE
jgi:hypothetical protein